MKKENKHPKTCKKEELKDMISCFSKIWKCTWKFKRNFGVRQTERILNVFLPWGRGYFFKSRTFHKSCTSLSEIKVGGSF